MLEYSAPQEIGTLAAVASFFAEKAGREEARVLPIRILVADDHPLVRESLEMLLQDFNAVDVVATVPDGRRAVEHCERDAPDVLILDYNMGQFGGVAAAREIKQRFPEVVIVGMSIASDVGEKMIAAGADYFFAKGDVPEELRTVLWDVRQRLAGEGTEDSPR